MHCIILVLSSKYIICETIVMFRYVNVSSLSDVVSTTSGPQKFASGLEGSRVEYVLQQIPLVNF